MALPRMEISLADWNLEVVFHASIRRYLANDDHFVDIG
jgi:hypothetical protein